MTKTYQVRFSCCSCQGVVLILLAVALLKYIFG